MKDAKDGRVDVVESLVGRAIRAGAPLRVLLARRDLAHAKSGGGRDGHGSGDLERRDWLDHLDGRATKRKWATGWGGVGTREI